MWRLLKGRMKFLVPALYLGLATYVWLDFMNTPPDGLANVGLMIVTLPITLIGLLLTWALGRTAFVLLPTSLGYYGDHALYYWPSVGLIALATYWLCAVSSRS
jgi:hypothetical protein